MSPYKNIPGIELQNGWKLRFGAGDGILLLGPPDSEGNSPEYLCDRVISLIGGGAKVVLDGQERYVAFTCSHGLTKQVRTKEICKICGKFLGYIDR